MSARKHRSLALQSAIVDLVCDEGEEPLTDEQTAVLVAELARKHSLTEQEAADLAEIATGPIGY